MEAKQLIKEKILESANQKAEEILARAKADCAKSLLIAENEMLKRREDSLKETKKHADEIVLQGEMLASLEGRKLILKEKRTLVDKVFSDAVDAIFGFLDKDYIKLMRDIVFKHAEDNDEVVICERDKSRLDKKWLDEISKSKGIKLKLASSFHNQKGGVILKSDYCDKKLTIEALVREISDKVENKVVKLLALV